MKIKDTEIIVIKNIISKNIKCVVFDSISQTSEDAIRNYAARSLAAAEKKKAKFLAFSASRNSARQFPYAAASKIIAQEVFRHLRNTKNPVLKKVFFVIPPRDIFILFKKNVEDYLKYMLYKLSQGPYLTVDGIVAYKGGIVMVERSNPPLGWALPGGFVDYGESVEEAVARELKEETNLSLSNVRQFKVYSAPGRDPRFHTVSVVFVAHGRGKLKADSDAKAAKVFKPDELPSKIAFDHRKIIGEYIRKFRLKTLKDE